MILFIFIVNTSEFAYFFFKSGESHQTRQRLLVPPLTGWLSHWPFVTNCGGERLPCNYLCVLLLYALAFHRLALTWRCV